MVDIGDRSFPPLSQQQQHNFDQDNFDSPTQFHDFQSTAPPNTDEAISSKRTYPDDTQDQEHQRPPRHKPQKPKKKKANEENLATKLAAYPPEKNAISILNEQKVPTVYELVGEEGPAHQRTFRMKATVFEMVYEGVGTSKKIAKEQAARAAVVALMNSGGENEGFGGLPKPIGGQEVEKGLGPVEVPNVGLDGKVPEGVSEKTKETGGSPLELPSVEELLATVEDGGSGCQDAHSNLE